MLEGELEAVKQAKVKEREQLEAQLAQQKEEARRAQDKLQVENSVRICDGLYIFIHTHRPSPHPTSSVFRSCMANWRLWRTLGRIRKGWRRKQERGEWRSRG